MIKVRHVACYQDKQHLNPRLTHQLVVCNSLEKDIVEIFEW